MTVRSNETKKSMRHSNSWPERAVTVKVRVDPISRAYTIIPSFYVDRLVEVAARDVGRIGHLDKLVRSGGQEAEANGIDGEASGFAESEVADDSEKICSTSHFGEDDKEDKTSEEPLGKDERRTAENSHGLVEFPKERRTIRRIYHPRGDPEDDGGPGESVEKKDKNEKTLFGNFPLTLEKSADLSEGTGKPEKDDSFQKHRENRDSSWQEQSRINSDKGLAGFIGGSCKKFAPPAGSNRSSESDENMPMNTDSKTDRIFMESKYRKAISMGEISTGDNDNFFEYTPDISLFTWNKIIDSKLSLKVLDSRFCTGWKIPASLDNISGPSDDFYKDITSLVTDRHELVESLRKDHAALLGRIKDSLKLQDESSKRSDSTRGTDEVSVLNEEEVGSEREETTEDKNRLKEPPVIIQLENENPSNYQDFVVSSPEAIKSRHACPKCKSDGFLQLQIDPFRPPLDLPKSKGNCVESGSFTNRRYRSQSIRNESRIEIDKSLGRRTKSFGENIRNKNENESSPRLPIDHRKETTLRRHYYPEGGWGYVIVTCSALVHFLGIGLQLSAPGSWHVSAELKFHHPPLHSAGRKDIKIFHIFLIVC
ncbi:uncharacterized protein LOC112494658 [Cephus cinctus]|uniref:Uncharacterized protein LOC112494658 n=1 Tax=Cephus cinctus TaxID=211228 RepID=A0AAJ7W390_CEPCN|nr:uncharacterized protein LOC112494658 [Cephus cinctus]